MCIIRVRIIIIFVVYIIIYMELFKYDEIYIPINFMEKIYRTVRIDLK